MVRLWHGSSSKNNFIFMIHVHKGLSLTLCPSGPTGPLFHVPHPGTRLHSQTSCGKLLVSEAEGDTEGSSTGVRWPGLDLRQPRPLIFLWRELVSLPTEHKGVGKGHLSRR